MSLGLAKGFSAITAPLPGSASKYGKQYETCYVSGNNVHKNIPVIGYVALFFLSSYFQASLHSSYKIT